MATTRFDPFLDAAAQRGASSRLTRAVAAAGAVAVYPEAPATEPRTLWQIFEATAAAFPEATAIDDGQSVLNYVDLLWKTRRAASRLASLGLGAGDRVGIRITSGTAELYLSILAVLSVGAAYVPVDVDDPADRAELVWSAAGVRAILGDGGELTWRKPGAAQAGARRPAPEDDAWVIFTSGTTGTPKGVAVTHRSAAAFVDAEASLFLRDDPLGPGDRVLAGLSVAFDASCEEMWLAWRHGACLVPAPRSVVRTGPDLVTLAGTTPGLRGLDGADAGGAVAVGPAARGPPADPGRRGLPAPAGRPAGAGKAPRCGTPTARPRPRWCPARPGCPAASRCASGCRLDGWRLAVVDPASGQPVPWGEVGELVIGGVGVARYLDAERGRRCLPSAGGPGPGARVPHR